MKKHLPSLLILLAGCLWGSMGLFVHSMEEAGLSNMQMVTMRGLVTSLVLFTALAAIKPSLLKIKLRHLWCFFGTGILSVIFFNYCYITTISTSSMAVAAVLLYTSPIFVMLLSRVLFKEKLTAKKWIALILAFAGCLLVSGILSGGADLTITAFLFGIGSGFGYALYSIFSRYAIQYGYSGWTITAYTFLFAAVGGAFLSDFNGLALAVQDGGIPLVGLFLLFAAVTTLLPYLFYTIGLQYTENSKAAVIVSIEPVMAAILGFSRGERPSLIAWSGILLVLLAVLLLSLPNKKKT